MNRLTKSELIDKIKSTKYPIAMKFYPNAKKVIPYLNIEASVDIETTSFYDENGQKTALPYFWVFGIGQDATHGRELSEFFELLQQIEEIIGENILTVYVHNLSYEFQFFYAYREWSKVFARETREPLFARTGSILFKDSFILSGLNLAKTAENITSEKLEKLVGDLDYSIIRTPQTQLTDKEVDYAFRDVEIVLAYIREQIQQYKAITYIPTTNTGRVREYCRKKCLRGKAGEKYKELMRNLTLTSDEYDFLKSAFMGGFTHANYKQAMKTHEKVNSYDINSSYPTVLVLEKYPMTKGEKITIRDREHFEQLRKSYAIIFDVRFTELIQKSEVYDSYLSISKCDTTGEQENNGRILSADTCTTTITEIDFDIIERCYDYATVTFGDAYIYGKAYLPIEFINCILDFYVDKTTLKDVKESEQEYQLKKGMLNSTYGMTVTDIVTDEVDFTDEWIKGEPDKEQQITDYNENKRRFLFYPWGVYCTAYARARLWNAILAVGEDYIYSDTDSVKYKGDHCDYFNEENARIKAKIEVIGEMMQIPIERYKPKTKKGNEKLIGAWENETDESRKYTYDKFKTIGAKRYLVQKGDKLEITCAGVNKDKVSEYLTGRADAFEYFNDKMVIDKEHSGRSIVTYIDERRTGKLTDYRGVTYSYDIPSCVHIEPSDFNLKIGQKYLTLFEKYAII